MGAPRFSYRCLFTIYRYFVSRLPPVSFYRYGSLYSKHSYKKVQKR
jgi:hypothetical protein